MKASFFSFLGILAVGLTCASLSYAGTTQFEVSCNLSQAAEKGTISSEGADSFDVIHYVIDLKTNTAKLKCAEKMDRTFCGIMRMDLSGFVGAYGLEKCERDTERTRRVFQFYVAQEDEFDHNVSVYFYENCKAKSLDERAASILVATAPSRELPDDRFKTTAVSCEVKALN